MPHKFKTTLAVVLFPLHSHPVRFVVAPFIVRRNVPADTD
jgi:hypothetical protein